jgi:hypothetical protein
LIVSESDILLAALDRRMAVDASLPIGAARAVSPGGRYAVPDPRTARAAAAAMRLPLGRTVTGQVLDVLDENNLLVDVDHVPLALSWPASGGPQPAIGQTIALRVLAHSPILLFETVAVPDSEGTGDAPLHLSPLARQLQRTDASDGKPIRFDKPILRIADASTADKPRETDAIPLSRIVVGTPAEVASRAPANGASDAAQLAPLVLQGPAWQGQEVEIVLRRDRADPAFENAALDQWCGEIVIELPQLGRVLGRLSWTVQGLRLRLEGDAGSAIEAMNEAGRELVTSLIEASLPVLAFSVGGPAGTEPSR